MFSHDDRILVAVSGGKDSLSLWDVLQQLGYHVAGLYINLGINDKLNYSAQSQQFSDEFAKQRDLILHKVNLKESYGENVPGVAKRTNRGKDKPCSVCGLIKRHIMNRITQEQGYDVLVTGHNLDDEAAVLFGNTFNWQVDYLLRQAPVLEEAPGFARKAKPFCRFTERETAAYAFLKKIDYIHEECPYATGSTSLYYKQLLNQIEEQQPGAKLRFYVHFLDARKRGLFVDHTNHDFYNQRCHVCNQPTTAPGICAFCRLFIIR